MDDRHTLRLIEAFGLSRCSGRNTGLAEMCKAWVKLGYFGSSVCSLKSLKHLSDRLVLHV